MANRPLGGRAVPPRRRRRHRTSSPCRAPTQPEQPTVQRTGETPDCADLGGDVAWRQGAPRDRRWRAGCQSHRQSALPFRHGSHREDRLGRRARHRCRDGFRRALIVWPVASPPPQAELTKAAGRLAWRPPPAFPLRLPVTARLSGQGCSWRLARGELRAGADGAESCSAAAGDAASPSQVSLVTVGLPLGTSR